MTTTTGTLAAWLEAQLAADEALAIELLDCDAMLEVLASAPCDHAMNYLLRQQPQAEIRRIEATRKVLTLHEGVVENVEWFDAPGSGEAEVCPSCHPKDPTEWNPPAGQAGVRPPGFVASYVLAPCPTIRALAPMYAGRDGYREEWKP
jgi:hypothetical protein